MARKVFRPKPAHEAPGWKKVDPDVLVARLVADWECIDPLFAARALADRFGRLPHERRAQLANLALQLERRPLTLDNPDGTTRRIYRRLLDPARNPEDRPDQHVVVPYTPLPGEALRFSTRPFESSAYDWAYTIKIEVK